MPWFQDWLLNGLNLIDQIGNSSYLLMILFSAILNNIAPQRAIMGPLLFLI